MSINLVPEYMLPKSSFIEDKLRSTGIASEPAGRADLFDDFLANLEAVGRSSSHHRDCAQGDTVQALAAGIN